MPGKGMVATRPLPLSPDFKSIKRYGIVAAFTVLSVPTPRLFHKIPAAVPTYLPNEEEGGGRQISTNTYK